MMWTPESGVFSISSHSWRVILRRDTVSAVVRHWIFAHLRCPSTHWSATPRFVHCWQGQAAVSETGGRLSSQFDATGMENRRPHTVVTCEMHLLEERTGPFCARRGRLWGRDACPGWWTDDASGQVRRGGRQRALGGVMLGGERGQVYGEGLYCRKHAAHDASGWAAG
jgi:hypothetical protein